MPIKEDFCHGDVKPIGKISLEGDEYFHWVWPSQGLVEASKDEKTLAAYKDHGDKMVKLGVSGTMVAVDWDSCVELPPSPESNMTVGDPRPMQFKCSRWLPTQINVPGAMGRAAESSIVASLVRVPTVTSTKAKTAN